MKKKLTKTFVILLTCALLFASMATAVGAESGRHTASLGDLDAICLGTREKKSFFGLIKKQERYLEFRTHGIMGIDAPIVVGEYDEDKEEFRMFLEKAKQFASDNDIVIQKI